MPGAILIRFPNWIGDTAMALPALDAARRHWPGARLGVIVHERARPLLEGHPAIDRFHSVPGRGRIGWRAALSELRTARYDLGLLLAHSFSSALHLFLAGVPERIGRRGDGRDWLLTRRLPPVDHVTPMPGQFLDVIAAAGYRGPMPPMRWVPGPAEVAAADRWLREHGAVGRDLVAIAPGAAHGPAKRWPPDRFGSLAVQLAAATGTLVLVFGTPVEAPIVEAVVASGGSSARAVLDLPLRPAAALLSRCRLLVANDSGLLHVARAAGVPVVGLYGSTTPEWSGPAPEEGDAITLRLPCSPCFARTCPRRDRPNECFEAIEVAPVLAAARRRWRDATVGASS